MVARIGHVYTTPENEIDFFTFMIRDSFDVIRAITGPGCETAAIPEPPRKYLSGFEARSAHYEFTSIHALPGF